MRISRSMRFWVIFLAAGASAGDILKTNRSGSTTGSSDADLICHTSNPSDCYPKVFQATNDFQKVHPDQDLPKGLHVRLNINTGEKEAKLNDPSEQVDSVAGLPVDSAVLVVDPESSQEDHVPPGAPAYEAVGKIKEPSPSLTHDFQGCASAVAKGAREVRDGISYYDALEKLEELSHDIYFGVQIAQDSELLKSLFCTMSDPEVFEAGPTPSGVDSTTLIKRARWAAWTIAAAVQNNPKALSSVEAHWPALLGASCPAVGGQGQSIGSLVFSTIILSREDPEIMASDRDAGPALVKAKLFALKGLLKGDKVRQTFLHSGGMREILRVLLHDDPDYTDAQVKAANLVADSFLDDTMGAVLGQWPTAKPSTAAQCSSMGEKLSDGCWDFHITRLAKDSSADETHWSHGLLALMKHGRGTGDAGGTQQIPHDEL